MPQHCSSCARVESSTLSLLRCAACSTLYCSAACQRSAWPTHKLVCKPQRAICADVDAVPEQSAVGISIEDQLEQARAQLALEQTKLKSAQKERDALDQIQRATAAASAGLPSPGDTAVVLAVARLQRAKEVLASAAEKVAKAEQALEKARADAAAPAGNTAAEVASKKKRDALTAKISAYDKRIMQLEKKIATLSEKSTRPKQERGKSRTKKEPEPASRPAAAAKTTTSNMLEALEDPEEARLRAEYEHALAQSFLQTTPTTPPPSSSAAAAAAAAAPTTPLPPSSSAAADPADLLAVPFDMTPWDSVFGNDVDMAALDTPWLSNFSQQP